MKQLFFNVATAVALGVAPRASALCFQFTQEHVDLLGVMWNSASNQLNLMASDDTHGRLYASNQCVVICPESMKFTLPSGTPLGNAGDPLWILPQNPYTGVPYVGVSAETVPAGVFNDPFTLTLTRLEGPGQFIVWQIVGLPPQYDIKIDTRDGISANDKLTLLVGGHAHYNWGFTTNGVYRAYFQASGVRVSQSTNNVSPETPFTFHVMPLRPFENWTATNWPCECATNIIAAGADPDGDHIVNVLEYAFGNNPNVALYTNVPAITFVTDGDTNYGALRYLRATNATDLTFAPVAAGAVTGATWADLSNIVSVSTNGATQTVTVRDSVPKEATTNRFYQLRVKLNYP
ncbi:MAG: choice-of-anchor M domain-containing protein [Verrucomicrobia bacterium]|jgi:surface-anchored protein|nr:choice-of-anchor M domain-containing protein [Verrucomicrobiota bacterium]